MHLDFSSAPKKNSVNRKFECFIIWAIITLSYSLGTYAQKNDNPDLQTSQKTDSLRHREIQMSVLSLLEEVPQDSIRHYTVDNYVQTVVALQINKDSLNAQNLMIVESPYTYIAKNLKQHFLSQASQNLFVNKEGREETLGPYLYTFRIEDNDSISIMKRSQLKNVSGLIEWSDLVESPVFPGCESLKGDSLKVCFKRKLNAHIIQNFKYPKESMSEGYQGNVTVYFTIDQNGELTKLYSKAGHPPFAEEAERIISLLPKMKPGSYRNLPIDTPFSIPILFRLN
ncbi:energy transducer TonB [Flavobacteriaceae bacterium M23B6Z8]